MLGGGGGAHLILYVPMFPWNFIFLQNEKDEGSKKRVVYIRTGEVSLLVHSPEVWEHPYFSH